MSENPEQSFFQDHIVVRHPDGRSEKVPLPKEAAVLKLGRELDNDIVFTDPRASRYHAEIRRTGDSLEIRDNNSSNGVLIGSTAIEPETWTPMPPGARLTLAETVIIWEQAQSQQATSAMPRHDFAAAGAAPAAAAAPPPQRRSIPALIPLAIIAAVIVLVLIVAAFFLFFTTPGGDDVAQQAASPVAGDPVATPAEQLSEQSLGTPPTGTPTPSGPQLPIPVVRIVSSEVQPIMLGGLPQSDRGLYLVDVRVENIGNAPFEVSTSDFLLREPDGATIPEAGGGLSEEGLRRLGVKDRFDGLNLTPGGSVGQSLLFELRAETYDLELIFSSPDLDGPVVLGLGTVQAGLELQLILGTPLPTSTPVPEAVAENATPTLDPTPTTAPTPTPTRPALIPAPQVVPRSALVGTIAYPVFNGTNYDVYFGAADGSGTRFYRGQASQPAFSADGSRIALRSWSDPQGIITQDVSGGGVALVANFIEDQLPTWTADGSEIVFLSRRTGDRKSLLYRVPSGEERVEAAILGEGEYPSIAPNGRLVFRGWGNTASGLRVADTTLSGIESVTNAEEDTAPSLSPDGQQVVFMSRRGGNNWDVYIVNIDGSDIRRLTEDEASDGLPIWSPDGNAIAFASDRGGPWAIWAMTPDGDGKRQLFTMEGSPDGFVGGAASDASRGWAEERISWTSVNLVNVE